MNNKNSLKLRNEIDQRNRLFDQFSIGEKTISIFIILFSIFTVFNLTVSLISYFMSQSNENVLKKTIISTQNGTSFSFDQCFQCTYDNNNQQYQINILQQFEMQNQNVLTQNTFKNNPVTFGNVYFPPANQNVSYSLPVFSQNWFKSKIRLYKNSDVVLTAPLTNPSLNSLQVGIFNMLNNQTGICTIDIGQHSSVYFGFDQIANQKYVCICIMNGQVALEGCQQLSSI